MSDLEELNLEEILLICFEEQSEICHITEDAKDIVEPISLREMAACLKRLNSAGLIPWD
ncbi:Uncharacterised protein [Mycobacteroides abscessus subsp. abscessus]|uniref:hypothetical protein n=1 Tax=Mycobacteroides abscessus TaxID=36809 RepID=UPI0009279ECD|nr:hypothetical protein [Mycobacteroides abscessus]SHT13756.1 Uncharacterised protein [Mycobacteroides abscessus subsp. abscessus]SKO60031.1 Uncharacterised protein [Mycobacteroides abscessus subsp. abscessus]